MRVGIIGLGNFGRFAAELLARDKDLEVIACDASDNGAPEGVKKVDLAEAASADAVVLCVPLAAYGEVLSKLKPLLKKETLVVDICSVKVEPNKQLRQYLEGHENLLVTHPMFGPQSAANGTAGHVLVVTDAVGQRAQDTVEYCEHKLGLNIMRMTNEEHDKAMADVHALTFFVARGLHKIGLSKSPFQAPSYEMLLDLVAFDEKHSEELFQTIEQGNPYAADARGQLLKALTDVHNSLATDKE